jgi:2-oxoacid:acceptor oxidoreductase gamma subunit (pyruvate/2-ketoisovalerate family)
MPTSKAPLAEVPLEIRVHGRGGQGGVTCAKLLAAIYAELGLFVQSFGDYGMERAGAPIRAFTRVDAAPITNRNKVYAPDHLLVLDPALLGDDVLEGVSPGALLVVNDPRPAEALAGAYAHLRVVAVDAAAIARRHGIGTSAVVIVNTTIAGAYARVTGVPWEVVERVYHHYDLADDLAAAREAYESASMVEPSRAAGAAPPSPRAAAPAAAPCVLDLTLHTEDLPTPLRTGSWRTQTPQYREHAAPCSASCPAGNDVIGFVQALRTGGVDAAARILLATQPLPSVCGRVCPAPCMAACNRAAYDGAVNVRALERWIGDRALRSLAVEPRGARRDVAVVGGGPAGLAAAFALARAGHAVAVLDAGPALGGVLRQGIPAYRLPPEALDRDLERLASIGVSARCGARLGPAEVGELARAHDAVVVASGLDRLSGLGVPGADLAGVDQGIAFLAAVKGGVSAAVDGHVVVVGGGNTAVDCARTALRMGASRVTLAYRRGRQEMPAIEEEIEEALAEGVSLLPLRQPVRFAGDGRVRAVELAEVELGEPDASGRRRPRVTDRTRLVPCDRVLLALGQSADLGVLPDGFTVREGRAWRAGEPQNVWVAGDLATGEGTVTHAIGDGRRAAERVLAEWALPAPAPLAAERPAVRAAFPAPSPLAGERAGVRGAPETVTPAHIRASYFAPQLPHRERRLAAAERRTSFAEVSRGLPGPEEAERCFSCGRCTRCDTCLLYCPEGIIRRQGDGYAIDGAYCKGCGMCVAECPRRAMEMTADGRVRA